MKRRIVDFIEWLNQTLSRIVVVAGAGVLFVCAQGGAQGVIAGDVLIGRAKSDL